MINSLAAMVAGALAVFGIGRSADRPDTKPFRPEFEKHASSTAAASVDIACVAAAVAAREASLDTSVATFGSDVHTAYTTRASSLASAYMLTDKDSIKKAVKDAWKTFGAALRVANKNWKKAQQDAWSQFKTAIKACGPGATSVVDGGNGAGEMKVQD